MIEVTFERAPTVVARTGSKRSSFFSRKARGLWTSGISLGPNSTAWPKHENDAILAAMLAGQSEDEIRALVQSLEEMRPEILASLLSQLSANKGT